MAVHEDKKEPRTVGIVSLGCAKNLVDSEAILGYLVEAGFSLTSDPEEADVIIVNTCGFIGPAKEESIDTIIEMAEYKKQGRCQKLVVAGCLAQRYHRDLVENIPEIDAVLGINEVTKILDVCRDDELKGDLVTSKRPTWLYDLQVRRVLTTPRHYAYLKVAEGCNHTCTFCAIPMIRGKYRSRSLESISREARLLVEQGVRELIIISQDTTYYGRDLGLKDGLYRLLDTLHEIEDIKWIRLLYLYPDTMPSDFARRMKNYPKLVPYLDLPLQHSHPDILRLMRRRGSRERYRDILLEYRQENPEIILRTTFIVGFPGETDEHFNDVLTFIKEVEFDHLGVFLYSDEEGTPAESLPSKVPMKVMLERRRCLMEAQQEIVRSRQARRVGKVLDVVIEGGGDNRETRWEYTGRFYGQAPEIDGVVYFTSPVPLREGTWVPVRITDFKMYDLIGEVHEPALVTAQIPHEAPNTFQR